ncbi:hypothetical protein LJC19_05085 [Oxalobacter sp. OttesenSCG-928-P03]|nr:hypothetical protein [Oxalobacter sp. OttesenSCG-928-P03]
MMFFKYSLKEQKMKNTPQHVVIQKIAEDLPVIYSCIKDGWAIYQKEYPEHLKIAHTSRSRASLVHDHIASLARQRLEPRFGVHCHEIQKLFLVSFNSGVVIRFKKLDDNFRSSNIRTQQSLGFMEQETLPEIGKAINLQAGYRLNELETDIEGIYLTLPIGESGNAWIFELNEADFARGNVVDLPTMTQQKSKGIRFTKKGGEDASESSKS